MEYRPTEGVTAGTECENMTEENKIDPTAMGLFLVATVSLPLALYNLIDADTAGAWDLSWLFIICGALIIWVGKLSHDINSNFGFIVFVMVGVGVMITGLYAYSATAMGDYTNLTLALVYLLSMIWSIWIKADKELTCLLVTTTLIFLTVGLNGILDIDDWHYVIGVVSLFNFIFNLWLAYGLATEGKVKYF